MDVRFHLEAVVKEIWLSPILGATLVLERM
jgi:hypothetical protein